MFDKTTGIPKSIYNNKDSISTYNKKRGKMVGSDLKLPKDTFPILSLLHYNKRLYNTDTIRTLLVKYLFLLEKEKKAKLHYRFIKDYYGPNDRRIVEDAAELVGAGLLNTNIYRTNNKKVVVYTITDYGELFYSGMLNRSDLKEVDNKCKETIKKYGNYKLQELKDIIYNEYCLDEPKLLKIRNQVFDEINQLKNIFSSYFRKYYCNSLLEILKIIDYCLYILRNYNSINDLIGKNTLIAEIREIVECLRSNYILLLEKGEPAIDNAFNNDFEFLEKFIYISDKAEQYGLKSMMVEMNDITDFMDEESKQCLMEETIPT